MKLEYPESVEAVANLVQSTTAVTIQGAGSHNGMLVSKAESDAANATAISLSKLAGIQEYEPSEFTITALAGTSICELQSALAEYQQYLPFDPLVFDSASTLGGIIASGLNGPGRLRYGGIRDFVLGVQCVDGLGNVIRGGGKVVKNAAGFDLPKLMVGSLGAFGLLTELTLKVFPQARMRETLLVGFPSVKAATAAMERLATQPIATEAVDLIPDFRSNNAALALVAAPKSIPIQLKGESLILIRLAGVEAAIKSTKNRIETTLEQAVISCQADPSDESLKGPKVAAHEAWWPMPTVAEDPFRSGFLLKVPLTLTELSELDHEIASKFSSNQSDVWRRYSGLGTQLWLGGNAASDFSFLVDSLTELGLYWQLIQGNLPTPLRMPQCTLVFGTHLKQAFDPQHRLLTIWDQCQEVSKGK